jgi:cytochrome c-type biogenesis protein CcmH/NrfG
MLGRVYLEEGRAAEAVEWFERAAAVSPPTSEEG